MGGTSMDHLVWAGKFGCLLLTDCIEGCTFNSSCSTCYWFIGGHFPDMVSFLQHSWLFLVLLLVPLCISPFLEGSFSFFTVAFSIMGTCCGETEFYSYLEDFHAKKTSLSALIYMRNHKWEACTKENYQKPGFALGSDLKAPDYSWVLYILPLSLQTHPWSSVPFMADFH